MMDRTMQKQTRKDKMTRKGQERHKRSKKGQTKKQTGQERAKMCNWGKQGQEKH